jgi:hypothetical protein
MNKQKKNSNFGSKNKHQTFAKVNYSIRFASL